MGLLHKTSSYQNLNFPKLLWNINDYYDGINQFLIYYRLIDKFSCYFGKYNVDLLTSLVRACRTRTCLGIGGSSYIGWKISLRVQYITKCCYFYNFSLYMKISVFYKFCLWISKNFIEWIIWIQKTYKNYITL